jgi:serine palmitoyltransferase
MTSYLKPKSRVRRLLGLNKRNNVNMKSEDKKEIQNISSKGNVFDDQTDDTHETVEILSTSSATSSLILSNHEEENDPFAFEDDPYADVRGLLEKLSRRDRHRYACNDDIYNHDDNIANDLQSREDEIHKQPSCHTVELPAFAAYTTYFGYAVLILCGHIRDLFAKILGQGRYLRDTYNSPYASDDLRWYAPLLSSWENFYTRRLYHRIQDCFNRPIASNPGANILVLERVSTDGNKTMSLLGTLQDLDNDRQRSEYIDPKVGNREKIHLVEATNLYNDKNGSENQSGRVGRACLNLGSYNYLGFADDWKLTCQGDVLNSLKDLPISNSSCRNEFGTTKLHREVEEVVARFLNKEDALALNMGFNTNCTTIPALTSRGDLLVSDELNHTSIVNGARASGAAIRIFRHNDTKHLEDILRQAIIMGRPRTRRPWNKIVVFVEGIYSMEGEYCDLTNVVRVCKKFGAYIYLDEAHSIGAMGPTGRGCAEYCGVDTDDIDIMMGTFTKSFGGMGGYIAGSKDVISFLRRRCAGSSCHNSLSPAVCQQVLSSFKVVMGEDGTTIGRKKIQALRDNSNYFRMSLEGMGLHVLGHYDSPIMPVMLYNPTKIAAFSRECYKRGLAVVVVGFPAVPILESRARFCISAGHTREQLDCALKEIEEVTDILKLRYATSTFG